MECYRSNEYFAALFENMPAQTIVVDFDGKIVFVNKAKRDSGDRIPEIGERMYIDYASKHMIDMRKELERCIKTGAKKEFSRMQYRNKVLNITIAPFEYGAMIISDDVTTCSVNEFKFNTLFSNITCMAIQGYSEDGTVVEWNKASEELYGYTEEEAIGRNIIDLIIPEKIRALVQEDIRRMFNSDVTTESEELQLLHKDGGVVDVFSSHFILTLPNGKKEMYCVDIDIGARKEMELELRESREVLRQMSFTDDLTGLYNRRYFNIELDREVSFARRHNQPLSIVMFDIDHFKRINDRYGHDNGDCTLKLVAKAFKSILRSEDIACRWGGEEFIVALPMSGREDSGKLANRLQKAIGNITLPFSEDEVITISSGVTQYERDDTPEALIKRADTLLFSAKNSGRNRVEIG